VNDKSEIDATTLAALRAEANAALLSKDAAIMHWGGLLMALLDDREALSAKLGEAEKERDEVLAKVKELNQQNTSLRRSLRTKLLSMIYATEGHATNDEPKVDTSDEACAVACTLVSNPQGALRKDGDGWQKRVNDLIRALRDERHKLATETIMTRVAVDALKAERDSALAQLAEARRENERLDRCLAFFASVIKSGEPWTETCEREYAAARSSLPQH
jgi:uncharacterized protein (DUF4415 family)